jgi:hypothetical protein
MVLPGSASIVPPLIRRTIVVLSLRASSMSTSLPSDWKLPMTTAGVAHSQIRSVGGRRPAAFPGQHLVQRQVQRRFPGFLVDEPPVVVAWADQLAAVSLYSACTSAPPEARPPG